MLNETAIKDFSNRIEEVTNLVESLRLDLEAHTTTESNTLGLLPNLTRDTSKLRTDLDTHVKLESKAVADLLNELAKLATTVEDQAKLIQEGAQLLLAVGNHVDKIGTKLEEYIGRMPDPEDVQAVVTQANTEGKSIRRRIHASTSVKNVKRLEHTVEGTGYTLEEALTEWDAQDAAVEARQPGGGE